MAGGRAKRAATDFEMAYSRREPGCFLARLADQLWARNDQRPWQFLDAGYERAHRGWLPKHDYQRYFQTKPVLPVEETVKGSAQPKPSATSKNTPRSSVANLPG